MQLSPILSNLNQSFRSTLRKVSRKVSWKSPQVIAGLSITLILTGGFTHYFSTTTSAAAVIINGQHIGLVQNVNSGKNLVETILKQQGEPFELTAKTHDEITYENIRVKDDVYLESSLNEDELKGK